MGYPYMYFINSNAKLGLNIIHKYPFHYQTVKYNY